MTGNEFIFGVLNSLVIGIVAGLSHGLKDSWGLRWIDTLVVGFLGGLGGGVLSGVIGVIGVLLFNWSSEGWGNWIFVWFWGGLGVGGTAGIVAGLLKMRREPTTEDEPWPVLRREGWSEFKLRLRRVLRRGGKAALIVGVLLSALAGMGLHQMVLRIGQFAGSVGVGLITTLSLVLIWILGGVGTGVWAGIFGTLWGGLRGGLTGPEIMRRTTPNQGIRQSAVNIGIFALVGGITIGTVMYLLNIVCLYLQNGSIPQDKWNFWLLNVLVCGVFSGLVPGAACIQHFILRFVLWCNGVMPWHYVCFLDFATEHMFLQRVGGRYRFLHDLLRDWFAAKALK
jgi:hypothetical protein